MAIPAPRTASMIAAGARPRVVSITASPAGSAAGSRPERAITWKKARPRVADAASLTGGLFSRVRRVRSASTSTWDRASLGSGRPVVTRSCQLERLQPCQAHGDGSLHRCARALAGHRLGYVGDVVRRGAAAATENIDDAAGGPLLQLARRSRGAVRRIRQRRWADRRWGRRRPGSRPAATAPPRADASARRPTRSSAPPRRGRAWRMEFQNASTVWPDRVRPERSVMVPETQMGRGSSPSSSRSRIALIGGLGVQRVEHRLHQEDVHLARMKGEGLLAIGMVDLVEGDRPLGQGRSRPARWTGCGLSGPIEPAT